MEHELFSANFSEVESLPIELGAGSSNDDDDSDSEQLRLYLHLLFALVSALVRTV